MIFGHSNEEELAFIKDNPLFKEIFENLYEHKLTRKWLLHRIKMIQEKNEDVIFSELLKTFTSLDIKPKKAKKTWLDILKHRDKMADCFGREVSLRVAMLDYFININKKMHNPKIIEIKIFEQMEKSIIIDPLTKLYNKQFFNDMLFRELQRARRYNLELSIMFIDIDDFKDCNETKGHLFGDMILQEVSKGIRAALRDSDFPCRFGGDEFVVILPETSTQQANIAAERIRENVNNEFLSVHDDKFVSISIGIASFGIDGHMPDEIIKNADEALYQAKREGKNRINLHFHDYANVPRMSSNWIKSMSISEPNGVKREKAKYIDCSGVFFEHKHILPVSSILQMEINPPNSKNVIPATAEVVKVKNISEGLYDIGICFTKIRKKDQKSIFNKL
jgi:diguanylate cyclase (GGDEF)-like protein